VLSPRAGRANGTTGRLIPAAWPPTPGPARNDPNVGTAVAANGPAMASARRPGAAAVAYYNYRTVPICRRSRPVRSRMMPRPSPPGIAPVRGGPAGQRGP